jgi:hypothetical protein
MMGDIISIGGYWVLGDLGRICGHDFYIDCYVGFL